MGSFRVPDVLLAVGSEDRTIVGNEVRRVVEELSAILADFVDDGPWHETDVEFLGESLVVGEILSGGLGLDRPPGIGGCPSTEMISSG